jgi:uncharacterized lipoprotein YehR (DUF1307 family)
MKKLMAIGIAMMLSITMLSACGSNERTGSSASSSETISSIAPSQNETDNGSASLDEIQDDKLMTIETKDGDLYYPAKYKDSLVTKESEENGILSVDFKAKIDGETYKLFKVMICDEEGDSVGTIKDSEGKEHNVFVDINEMDDISDLDEDVQNQLYSMQEGVNVLIDNLK